MSTKFRLGSIPRGRAVLTAATATAALLISNSIAAGAAGVALRNVSTDPYTNSDSQHHTEVEPDSFSWGSTEVAAFQVGRFFDGGSSNIGWATTLNNGSTWTHGFLPGITNQAGGPFTRATDPSVAYDQKHKLWLIGALGMVNTQGAAVLVSRSANATTWSKPVVITRPAGASLDKPWVACDNFAHSPHYGNCYAEWDDNGNGDLVYLSTSSNGGASWGKPKTTPDSFAGLGGQPSVLPNGTVVVPINNSLENAVDSIVSTNGGSSWTAAEPVSPIAQASNGGGLRQPALIAGRADASGKVYVVWQDCRFEPGCANNDLVMTTSTNGLAWTPPVRVAIGKINSGADYFLPGLGIDPTTSGATAHLGIVYYFYPNGNCNFSTCKLEVGYVSSKNGGTNWGAAVTLTSAMSLSWLPATSQGPMVGDYMNTSFLNKKAFPVFPVASARSGSVFNQGMFAPAAGLA